MEFSVNMLNNMESDLNSVLKQILKATKVDSANDLTHESLAKMNKENLIKFVMNLSKLADKSVSLCKSAAGVIDELKTEQLLSQRKLIETQQQQNDAVQQTVKSEMKSWSDIVKKNLDSNCTSVTSVRKAVKSVVEEDSRCKNVIVYGVPDSAEEDIVGKMSGMFNEICQLPGEVPHLFAVQRIGNYKDEVIRPIKVTLHSNESVKYVLNKAKKLKDAGEYYSKIYLAPDRNKEERTAHNKLVVEMKRLIVEQPDMYHLIRNGKVISMNRS